MSICLKGKQQSPININSNISKRCGATCDLTFFYKTSKLNIKNFNNDIIIEYDTGSYINFNQEIYELEKISFTTPSSHKIDNDSHPCEAHLYHRSPYNGKILIIGIFIDVNEAESGSLVFLNSLLGKFPKKNQEISINTNDKWNIYNLIPNSQAFFLYNGSLTREPCSENITWIIYDEPINCSKKFFTNLKNISKNNARSIKKIGSRAIYFNPNTSKKNQKNYGSEGKMRCYTEAELNLRCTKIKNDTDARNKANVVNIRIMKPIIFFIFIFVVISLFKADFTSLIRNSFNKFLSNKFIDQ